MDFLKLKNLSMNSKSIMFSKLFGLVSIDKKGIKDATENASQKALASIIRTKIIS